MRNLNSQSLSFGLAFFVLTVTMNTPSAAQSVQTYIQIEEPARWTQEDITPQQKLSTATKEAIAAQQQSIQNCQILDPTPRAACIALARITYKEDMAFIRTQFFQ